MLGQGLGQVLGTDDLIKETQCLVKNKSVGSLSTPRAEAGWAALVQPRLGGDKAGRRLGALGSLVFHTSPE